MVVVFFFSFCLRQSTRCARWFIVLNKSITSQMAATRDFVQTAKWSNNNNKLNGVICFTLLNPYRTQWNWILLVQEEARAKAFFFFFWEDSVRYWRAIYIYFRSHETAQIVTCNEQNSISYKIHTNMYEYSLFLKLCAFLLATHRSQSVAIRTKCQSLLKFLHRLHVEDICGARVRRWLFFLSQFIFVPLRNVSEYNVCIFMAHIKALLYFNGI